MIWFLLGFFWGGKGRWGDSVLKFVQNIKTVTFALWIFVVMFHRNALHIFCDRFLTSAVSTFKSSVLECCNSLTSNTCSSLLYEKSMQSGLADIFARTNQFLEMSLRSAIPLCFQIGCWHMFICYLSFQSFTSIWISLEMSIVFSQYSTPIQNKSGNSKRPLLNPGLYPEGLLEGNGLLSPCWVEPQLA